MSNEAFFLGFISAALTGSLALCIWKISSCLKSILDSTSRSIERERRDYLQLVEKLLEKRDILPQHIPGLAAQHGQERVQRISEDARTDVASVPKIPSPSPPLASGVGDLINTDDPSGLLS